MTAPVERVHETERGHVVVLLTAMFGDRAFESQQARQRFLNHVGTEAFQLDPREPTAAMPTYDDIARS